MDWKSPAQVFISSTKGSYAHHRGMARDVGGHQGVGADNRVVSHPDQAGHGSVRSEVDPVADRGHAPSLPPARDVDRDTLGEVAALPDHGTSVDDHRPEVADVEARTDRGGVRQAEA